MLFDQIHRQDKRPQEYSQSIYEYINLSALKPYKHIRSLLKDWFSHFPVKHQNDLEARFRSSDDYEFLSAFFELYIHELLIRLGFELEIHPYIERKSTHPDFLAFLNNKSVFYLECIVPKGSLNDIAAEKRKNIVYDTLNKLVSPYFDLGITVHGKPNTPPPGAKWRRFLKEELLRLDPDKVEARKKAEGLPCWSRKHDGWNVDFLATPKPLERRGKPSIRPIGLRIEGFRFEELEGCKTQVKIRNAIEKKATGYSKINLPFIVAINVIGEFCDDIFIANALFGKKNIVRTNTPNRTLNLIKKHYDGAWWNPKGPQNICVSAVFLLKNLFPWNMVTHNPIIWHNPWAEISLNPNILPLPQIMYNCSGKYREYKTGKSAREIFNFPPNWPRIEEDDDIKNS